MIKLQKQENTKLVTEKKKKSDIHWYIFPEFHRKNPLSQQKGTNQKAPPYCQKITKRAEIERKKMGTPYLGDSVAE